MVLIFIFFLYFVPSFVFAHLTHWMLVGILSHPVSMGPCWIIGILVAVFFCQNKNCFSKKVIIMGYQTQYELHCDQDDLLDKIWQEQGGEEGDTDYTYALAEDGCTNCECKWYDHESDLKEISKKYPTALFTLNCLGEDGAESKKYFRDGKMQRCPAVVTFDDFDPKKLK